MFRILTTALILIATTASANAACPPAAYGNSAEAIKGNQDRIICLQQELSAQTNRRKLEFDITALQRSLSDMQVQQRINALPHYVAPFPEFR